MSPPAPPMRRVLVIGPGGAGKSTLARQMGDALGLPIVHLDAEYWQPGWVELPKADWAAQVERLLAEDAWILDGNFGGTLDQRLAAADTVVFLDLPPLVCLFRVVQRWVRYHGQARPDMTPGCAERLDLRFLWWIASYRWQHRRRVLARLRAAPHVRVAHLRSRRGVRTFLAAVPGA